MTTRIIAMWTKIDPLCCEATITIAHWPGEHHGPSENFIFTVKVEKHLFTVNNGPYILYNGPELQETPLHEKLKIMCRSYFEGVNRDVSSFCWELS